MNEFEHGSAQPQGCHLMLNSDINEREQSTEFYVSRMIGLYTYPPSVLRARPGLHMSPAPILPLVCYENENTLLYPFLACNFPQVTFSPQI